MIPRFLRPVPKIFAGIRKGIPSALFAAFALAGFSSSRAAQVTWGGSAGSWITPANWLGGVAPTVSDTVLVGGDGPTLSGGDVGSYGDLHLGQGSDGTLTLSFGGGHLTGTNVYVGGSSAAHGSLMIYGGKLEALNHFSLGYQGFGMLTMMGGELQTHSASISDDDTGVAELIGGTWHNTDTIRVGGTIKGELVVNGGASVVTANLLLDSQEGVNKVEIKGGTVTATHLTVSSNSRVELHSGRLVTTTAEMNGAGGTIRVDGGSLEISGTTYVGHSGIGALEITGGSVSSARNILIGSAPGSQGNVIMTGGTWTGERELIIGNGAITLSGGHLSQGDVATVGMSGTGTVTVNGGTWSNAGGIRLGDYPDSTGHLIINGGRVELPANTAVYVDNGTISIANNAELATRAVYAVRGTLTLDGGFLVATGDTEDYIAGFADGDVRLTGLGGTIDTQGFTVGISIGLSSGFSGTGRLRKSGSGTLILSSANTHTGGTEVFLGTLQVDGSVTGTTTVTDHSRLTGTGTTGDLIIQSGGTLAPGHSPGLLTVDGALTFEAGSTLVMEIASTSLYDRLAIASTFTAGGTLFLDVGFTPLDGDFFTIFTDGFAGRGWDAGSFTITTNLGGGKAWDTSLLASSGVIRVIPEPTTAALFGLGFAISLLGNRRRA